jgi:hypothetical protein
MLDNLFTKDPYDDLVDFIDAAVYSKEMSSWLEMLEKEPDSARIIQLAEMKSRMEHNDEPGEYIKIVGLLENRDILRAMNQVIREVSDSGQKTKKYLSGGGGGSSYQSLMSLMATAL